MNVKRDKPLAYNPWVLERQHMTLTIELSIGVSPRDTPFLAVLLMFLGATLRKACFAGYFCHVKMPTLDFATPCGSKSGVHCLDETFHFFLAKKEETRAKNDQYETSMPCHQ